jgi:hypothetical protein
VVQEALPELLPPPWELGLEDLDVLPRAAGILFIIASTAIRFILNNKRYDPKSQMAKLLNGFAEDYTGK